MALSRPMTRRRCAPRRNQRGIVMAITLISLVLLLVALAAMLRTVDTSSMVVGNLAFRRDITNRAEAAILKAKTALAAGTFAVSNAPGSNYSAARLAETDGMPSVLLSDSAYNTATYACIPSSCSQPLATDQILLRWVIDRQCIEVGTFDTAMCEFVPVADDTGGSAILAGKKAGGSVRPVYRISVRVTGPRGAEAYFQTTYAD